MLKSARQRARRDPRPERKPTESLSAAPGGCSQSEEPQSHYPMLANRSVSHLEGQDSSVLSWTIGKTAARRSVRNMASFDQSHPLRSRKRSARRRKKVPDHDKHQYIPGHNIVSTPKRRCEVNMQEQIAYQRLDRRSPKAPAQGTQAYMYMFIFHS